MRGWMGFSKHAPHWPRPWHSLRKLSVLPIRFLGGRCCLRKSSPGSQTGRAITQCQADSYMDATALNATFFRTALGVSHTHPLQALSGLKGVQPPLPFGERTRDCSPGHAGKEGPQLAVGKLERTSPQLPPQAPRSSHRAEGEHTLEHLSRLHSSPTSRIPGPAAPRAPPQPAGILQDAVNDCGAGCTPLSSQSC